MGDDPRARLRDAVGRAWSVFEPATSTRVKIGYGDADDLRRQDRLRGTRLRDWNDHLARDYVLGSWADDAKGLRHVLPRLLELLDPDRTTAADAASGWGLDLLIKFEFCDLPSWSEEQRAVVSDYFAAWGEIVVAEAPRAAAGVLGLLANVVSDVRPLLRAVGGKAAAELIVEWFERGAVVGYPVAVTPQVEAWMREPETRRQLEEAFDVGHDDRTTDVLARAIDVLAAWTVSA